MRPTAVLLALTLVAGCRTATAPTLLSESMRYGVPGAPTWLSHRYPGNDRFPDLADLTYHRVGDEIQLVARFVSKPPTPIGDHWFGAITLGDQPTDEGSFQRFGVSVGYSTVDGYLPPESQHISNDGILDVGPAQVEMRGNDLVMTCDASRLDFVPRLIVAGFTADPECCGQYGTWIRELGANSPVAAVDR